MITVLFVRPCVLRHSCWITIFGVFLQHFLVASDQHLDFRSEARVKTMLLHLSKQGQVMLWVSIGIQGDPEDTASRSRQVSLTTGKVQSVALYGNLHEDDRFPLRHADLLPWCVMGAALFGGHPPFTTAFTPNQS